MLKELLIKNFVLIDELRLQLAEGFICFTGETGAGKSILVEALGLLSGGRADVSLIRAGEVEAIVEGVFDAEESLALKLADEGIDLKDDPLIIRRVISTQGKSRIFINGHSATLSQLEHVAFQLLDLAGQHDQQSLLKKSFHRSFLDAASEVQKPLVIFKEAYDQYQLLKNELDALRQQLLQKNNRLDFLRFQLAELDKAKLLHPQEEDELLAEKTKAKNASQFVSLSQLAHTQEEKGALQHLDILIQQCKKMTDLDSRLITAVELLETARINVTESVHHIATVCENVDLREGRLEQIESRLYQLFQLKKKYGATLQDIFEQHQKIKEEIALLDQGEDLLLQKEQTLKQRGEKMLALAGILSEARTRRAKLIEKEVEKELKSLGMAQARFRWQITSTNSLEKCSSQGIDEVYFEIAPNPGEGFKALNQIASGGELSRVLLALKATLSGGSSTFLFDEIDAGIGGETGLVIGKKLKKLSMSSQVLCVTHLPQVASQAQQHFVIKKVIADKRTSTQVQEVQAQNRVEEIARMLGGVSARALEHAQDMLNIA